jgi:hypothetical protein
MAYDALQILKADPYDHIYEQNPSASPYLRSLRGTFPSFKLKGSELWELLVGILILDPGLLSFIKDSLADIDRRLVRIQASERSKFDTGVEDVARQSQETNCGHIEYIATLKVRKGRREQNVAEDKKSKSKEKALIYR